MAWEEEQEGSAEISSEGMEPPKKSPIKLIVFIVIGLAVLGGAGFAAKMFFFNKDEAKVEEKADGKDAKSEEAKDGEKKEGEAEGEDEAQNVILGLEPFIVNLSGADGRRYLKTTIRLELNSKDLMELINQPTSPWLFKTKDAILEILSSKTVEEVLPVDNRRDLRNEIMFRLNRIYEKAPKKGKVVEVYFIEFLVD